MLLTLLRGRTVLTMVLGVVMVTATVAYAADTAADLLKQGLKQVDAGQYAEAQKTLNRVDRVQLTDDQKQSLDQAKQQIAGYINANEQLAAARKAEAGGNLQQAKELYRQITADVAAPRKVRQEALNGLARVERRLMGGQEPTPVVVETQPAPQAVVVVESTNDDLEPIVIGPAEGGNTTPSETETESAPTGNQPPVEVVEIVEVETDNTGVLAQARLLRAQQLVAEGQAAAADGNYAAAANAYEQALANDPTNKAAKQGLANVQAAGSANQGVLGTEVTAYKLRRQRALARYEESMTAASKALAAGNYPQATDEASLAKSILDTNRQVIAEAEYRKLRQEALDLASNIAALEEQQRIKTLATEQQAIAVKQDIAREQAEKEKTQKINELLRRARDLSREQSYEQALEQLEQVLFLDPNNPAAKFMRDLITDQMIQVNWAEVKRLRGIAIAKGRVDALRDTIPHTELLIYPADWPELTRRRLADQNQFSESEANRVTREKLQQPIPVDFNANRLENVIEYLRNVTGANFFVQWRALDAAGIAKDTPITMQLQNVAAAKALRLILDEAGGDLVKLDFTVDEGVVIVATKEFLAQKTTIRTYDIRDLTFQVPTYNDSPEFDLEQVASDSGDSGGSSIFSDVGDETTEQLSPEERTIEIMDLIRNSVDPDEWRAAGGLTSSMEELNGSLIVNTTPENHGQIISLLRMLREQQALQIVVESRFLFVTQNFLEEVGLDIDVFLNDSPSWVAGQPGFIQSSADKARAQSTTVDGTLAPVGDAALAFGSIAAAGGGALAASPLGLLIDDLQVNVLIRATQQDTRNITLNTPRLTIFNNDLRPAYITIAQQTAFVSDLEPIVADGVAAFDPEIDVVQSGITMTVKGAISADRRYVRLYVQPSLAQLVGFTEFPVFSGTSRVDNDGDGLFDEDPINGIDDDNDGATDEDPSEGGGGTGLIQQPSINVTTLETQVSVPDKGTLLLGGQRLVGEVEVESGVPVLSKVPLLNRLFTNRAITRDERTLLILVKPTIIVQSEQEEQLFPGLNQAPELYNLGANP